VSTGRSSGQAAVSKLLLRVREHMGKGEYKLANTWLLSARETLKAPKATSQLEAVLGSQEAKRAKNKLHDCPDPPGRFSARSVFHSRSVLSGAFVCTRRANNSPIRRSPARADIDQLEARIKPCLEAARAPALAPATSYSTRSGTGGSTYTSNHYYDSTSSYGRTGTSYTGMPTRGAFCTVIFGPYRDSPYTRE
jgi:hypothetical protein